jgi:flagellar protein FliS
MALAGKKFRANQRGASAYATMGLEAQVAAASPEQLITMLFDGAENWIKQAKIHIENKDMAAKGNALSRAIDIINQGLLSALDADRGSEEIVENLSAIYDYAARKLMEVNRTNNLETLEHVEGVLYTVSSAWREMAATNSGA